MAKVIVNASLFSLPNGEARAGNFSIINFITACSKSLEMKSFQWIRKFCLHASETGMHYDELFRHLNCRLQFVRVEKFIKLEINSSSLSFLPREVS